ncbi:AAA family ATPase, partial [Acidovorax sp. 106]|uniref:AAA family ATPase n=1 Tax=Acidovorax sp. 106 TaxID=2135637 RepID=UPI00351A7BAE
SSSKTTPSTAACFGSIEAHSDGDTPHADYTGIRAGSLLRAHGGFLLLHLHDLTTEEGLWARLRRFLRCNRLHIDESGSNSSGAPVALQPEAVAVNVKIVLIGSVDEYYALQDADPDTARRFRAKVDFVERFAASPATRQASASLWRTAANAGACPTSAPPPWPCCWSKPPRSR